MSCLEGNCAHDLGQRFLECPQRRVPRGYDGQPVDDRSRRLDSLAVTGRPVQPPLFLIFDPLCHDVPACGNLFLERA